MKPQEHWNAQHYAANARFVSDLGTPVLDLLAPQKGERILDLGCGDGALTHKLAALGCEVIGVDGSAAMIDAAKALGLDARVMDGQALCFDEEFDAVFSNAALHWMKNPEAVIGGVWRALRHGGRFAAEMGGQGNIDAIVKGLDAALTARGLNPESLWFFPSAAQYLAMLEAQGFEVRSISLFPRPTPLPGDVGAWIETFVQPWLKQMPEAERMPFVAEVTETLRPVMCGADGRWIADYVRLRFLAIRP
jgi:trans-aconitate methyltransferase